MGPKPWTIKTLLTASAEYLQTKGVENPRLDAEVLLAHLMGTDRVSLYLNMDQPLTENELSGYRQLIRRRAGREPLQYITSKQEFWSLEFGVSPDVLIPRPESELLVAHTLDLIKASKSLQEHGPSILDLGTGCGAIAVSLAVELPQARIWATDISEPALEVARSNADRHQVMERIQFLQGDLWDPVSENQHAFDIILSNPPYVAAEEYDDLPPEVRDHEPRLALDGHRGGMYHIGAIIASAPTYLNPGGWLMMEMAPLQTERALGLMTPHAGYINKARLKDYSHHYRLVMAQKDLTLSAVQPDSPT
jgi:release factor glutamine methyltransferase